MDPFLDVCLDQLPLTTGTYDYLVDEQGVCDFSSFLRGVLPFRDEMTTDIPQADQWWLLRLAVFLLAMKEWFHEDDFLWLVEPKSFLELYITHYDGAAQIVFQDGSQYDAPQGTSHELVPVLSNAVNPEIHWLLGATYDNVLN